MKADPNYGKGVAEAPGVSLGELPRDAAAPSKGRQTKRGEPKCRPSFREGEDH